MKQVIIFTTLFLSLITHKLDAALLGTTTGPTIGGINIIITAQGVENFGVQGGNCSVFIASFGPAAINSWTPTQIDFVLPAGAGQSLIANITIQNLTVYTSSNSFTYNGPVISNLNPNHGPTTGGTPMQLNGSNFGPITVLDTVTFGSNTVAPITHTHILANFNSPAGTGTNKLVKIKVAGQQSNTVLFSYDPPTVTGISPSNGPTIGGTTVTLTGTNFGPPGTMASVLMGSYSGSSVTVVNHTTLTFVTPVGTGTGHTVFVTIDGQTSVQNITFSYQAPTVTFINPTTGPTIGNTITVTGTNFGPPGTPASVTIGGAPATQVTVLGHTSLTCKTPVGVGTNKQVVVSVTGQMSTQLVYFNYLPASLTSINPTTAPTIADTPVIAKGSNFGPAGTSALVLVGGSLATNVVVIGHDSISFNTPPGAGMNKNVVISVSGQSSLQTVYFNYSPPTIFSINPTHGPTVGGIPSTITGLNFGPLGTSASVKVGNNIVTGFVITSHTIVSFNTPPGAGGNVNTQLTIDGQTSNLLSYAYDPPLITTLTPNHGPTIGGTSVMIQGNNFGPSIDSIEVKMNGVPLPSVNYINHATLQFTAPTGSGSANSIVVSISGQISNTLNYSYDAPTITSFSPMSGPEQGGTLVVLQGTNFGPVSDPVSVKVGITPALNVVHLSHTQISFTTPAGTGMKTVEVTANGQTVTSAASYSYIHLDPAAVGIGTLTPAASSILDVSSTTSGILIPRMTTAQRIAIPGPANGLLVYDTNLNAFYFFNGTAWKKMSFE